MEHSDATHEMVASFRFVMVANRGLDTLLSGHSAIRTLGYRDALLSGHSAIGTLCYLDTQLSGRSAIGTLCHWGHSKQATWGAQLLLCATACLL
ncbi:MAG: hypothetical protein ACK52S_12915, partial [Pirellula sp.]